MPHEQKDEHPKIADNPTALHKTEPSALMTSVPLKKAKVLKLKAATSCELTVNDDKTVISNSTLNIPSYLQERCSYPHLTNTKVPDSNNVGAATTTLKQGPVATGMKKKTYAALKEKEKSIIATGSKKATQISAVNSEQRTKRPLCTKRKEAEAKVGCSHVFFTVLQLFLYSFFPSYFLIQIIILKLNVGWWWGWGGYANEISFPESRWGLFFFISKYNINLRFVIKKSLFISQVKTGSNIRYCFHQQK